MVKNIIKNIIKILIFVLVYLLQIYVFNNSTIFGVNGDLCLMAVVVTALIEKNNIAYITAGICGLVSDVLFSSIPCKYLVIYIIVVSILIGLKKMYKQDSKLALIVFSVIGIMASEIMMYIFNIMSNGQFVNIFSLALLILKESVINICLAFGIYLMFRLCSKEG